MASRRGFVSVIVSGALMALSLWPCFASAQSRPAADDAGRAEPREEQRQRANDDDWFRAPVMGPGGEGAYAGGPVDFPAAEVHDAVVANTRAAAARAMFRRAESELGATVRRAQRDFETSPALREAQANEQRAYDAYEAARRDALKDVTADAKYQAMQDLRNNLTRQIADRREAIADTEERMEQMARTARVRLASSRAAAMPAPREDLVAMAELKMRVGADARAMERDALARDDRVRSARDEYLAASARVAAVRADFDRKVREDKDLQKARETLEDARIARLTAETYFHGADLAAGIALDFAYYLHRYDYYRYNHYYDPGYYGSYFVGYPGYGFTSRPNRSVP